jgi:hypothetical protein
LGAGAQNQAISRNLSTAYLSSRQIIFIFLKNIFLTDSGSQAITLSFLQAIKNPVAGPGFWGVPRRRARASMSIVLAGVQVMMILGWAVHRLRKAQYVFTLVKDSASDVLMSWEIILELSDVAPESQRLGRHAKDFRSFAGVQIFRHSSFLLYALRLQTRVSTPDLSIHGNCLESGRQGAAADFS